MLGFVFALLAGSSYGDALPVRSVAFLFWSYVALDAGMQSQLVAQTSLSRATQYRRKYATTAHPRLT